MTLSFSRHIQFLSNFNITRSIYELFLPFLQADVGSMCHTLRQTKDHFPISGPRESSLATLGNDVLNFFCPAGDQPHAEHQPQSMSWPSLHLPATHHLKVPTSHSSTASAASFMPGGGIIGWLIKRFAIYTKQEEKYCEISKVGIWRGIAIFNDAVREVLPEIFSISSTGRAPILLEKKPFNRHFQVRSVTSLLLSHFSLDSP